MPEILPAMLHQTAVPARMLARRMAEARAWCPGIPGDEVPHGEVFAHGADAAGAAFALALAADRLSVTRTGPAADPLADTPDERPWLWVQDRKALRLTGRPYRPGLPRALRHRLVHVEAASCEDALFALEEGLRCRDLAFVIGEIAGNPRALDMTASRRLSLAAERHGVPFWLVRIDARRDLSSARMRWEVSPWPSPPPRWDAQAPGTPAWKAELFRARRHPPGTWILHEEDACLRAKAPGARPRGFGPGLASVRAATRQAVGAWDMSSSPAMAL